MPSLNCKRGQYITVVKIVSLKYLVARVGARLSLAFPPREQLAVEITDLYHRISL